MPVEIRPIHEHEAGAFLRVLCDVFSLDFQRATSIFFTEPMYDIQRKWALFESGEIKSILTTSALEFGWGRCAGIAGVATPPKFERQGYARMLLEAVIEHGTQNGEAATLLFAKRTELYAALGFEQLDVVEKGLVVSEPYVERPQLTSTDVQRIYSSWAKESPNRLLRDARRWKYWDWLMRIGESWGDGYICYEGTTVRELIPGSTSRPISVPKGTTWSGLTRMRDQLAIQLENTETELILMGYQVPVPIEMFMTDQF